MLFRSLQVGLATPNVLEARVNRAMVKAAQKVVAVCDSSKFNRGSLALIVPTSEIDHLITDDRLPPEELRAIREAGIEVTVV